MEWDMFKEAWLSLFFEETLAELHLKDMVGVTFTETWTRHKINNKLPVIMKNIFF